MKDLGHFPMSEDPPKFIGYLLPVLEKIRADDGVTLAGDRNPPHEARHVPRRSRPHAASGRRRDRRASSQFTGSLRYDALPEDDARTTRGGTCSTPSA